MDLNMPSHRNRASVHYIGIAGCPFLNIEDCPFYNRQNNTHLHSAISFRQKETTTDVVEDDFVVEPDVVGKPYVHEASIALVSAQMPSFSQEDRELLLKRIEELEICIRHLEKELSSERARQQQQQTRTTSANQRAMSDLQKAKAALDLERSDFEKLRLAELARVNEAEKLQKDHKLAWQKENDELAKTRAALENEKLAVARLRSDADAHHAAAIKALQSGTDGQPTNGQLHVLEDALNALKRERDSLKTERDDLLLKLKGGERLLDVVKEEALQRQINMNAEALIRFTNFDMVACYDLRKWIHQILKDKSELQMQTAARDLILDSMRKSNENDEDEDEDQHQEQQALDDLEKMTSLQERVLELEVLLAAARRDKEEALAHAKNNNNNTNNNNAKDLATLKEERAKLEDARLALEKQKAAQLADFAQREKNHSASDAIFKEQSAKLEASRLAFEKQKLEQLAELAQREKNLSASASNSSNKSAADYDTALQKVKKETLEVQKEMEKAMKKMQSELEEARTRLNEKESTTTSLSTSLDNTHLQQQIAILNSQIENFRNEAKNKVVITSDNSKSEQQIALLTTQIENLQSQITRLTRESNSTDQSKLKLQEEMDALQRQLNSIKKELQDAIAIRKSLESQRNDLMATISRLERALLEGEQPKEDYDPYYDNFRPLAAELVRGLLSQTVSTRLPGKVTDWTDFSKISFSLGQLVDIKSAFRKADRGNKGVLDMDSLGLWVQSIGMKNITYEQLKTMIKQVDTNRDGVVDFWEFFGIQSYLSAGLQYLDLNEWMLFCTQSVVGGDKNNNKKMYFRSTTLLPPIINTGGGAASSPSLNRHPVGGFVAPSSAFATRNNNNTNRQQQQSPAATAFNNYNTTSSGLGLSQSTIGSSGDYYSVGGPFSSVFVSPSIRQQHLQQQQQRTTSSSPPTSSVVGFQPNFYSMASPFSQQQQQKQFMHHQSPSAASRYSNNMVGSTFLPGGFAAAADYPL